MNVIVVGVDGSADSLAALRFALREARAHDAVLRVVSVWHVPALIYSGGSPVPSTLSDDIGEGARVTIADALAAVGDECESVVVQRVAREGDPGRVLVAESQDAQLLVVGSRSHGSIGELLLGSVSHYCCRHAHCPVMVIPHSTSVD